MRGNNGQAGSTGREHGKRRRPALRPANGAASAPVVDLTLDSDSDDSGLCVEAPPGEVTARASAEHSLRCQHTPAHDGAATKEAPAVALPARASAVVHTSASPCTPGLPPQAVSRKSFSVFMVPGAVRGQASLVQGDSDSSASPRSAAQQERVLVPTGCNGQHSETSDSAMSPTKAGPAAESSSGYEVGFDLHLLKGYIRKEDVSPKSAEVPLSCSLLVSM